MEKISIITPVYKGNKYLTNLLTIIEKATYKLKNFCFEWILINDSPQVPLKKLTSNNKNLIIKKLDNPYNLGIQKSRIKGVQKSKGKYIVFLDQDDLIDSNFFKAHLANIKETDVSISNGYVEQKNGKLKKIFNTKRQLNCVKNLKIFFYVGDIIVSPGMALIKKSSIPQSWLNNPLSINGADDWLLWVLMLTEGNSFSTIFRPLYIHKKNDTGNASDNKERMWLSTSEALEKYSNIIQNKNSHLVKVFKRRIRLIESFQLEKKNKLLLYSLNPDILFFVIDYKIIRRFS